MRNTEQDNLKYQKLYHWAHTLITSGVIKIWISFRLRLFCRKIRLFQADGAHSSPTVRG